MEKIKFIHGNKNEKKLWFRRYLLGQSPYLRVRRQGEPLRWIGGPPGGVSVAIGQLNEKQTAWICLLDQYLSTFLNPKVVMLLTLFSSYATSLLNCGDHEEARKCAELVLG